MASPWLTWASAWESRAPDCSKVAWAVSRSRSAIKPSLKSPWVLFSWRSASFSVTRETSTFAFALLSLGLLFFLPFEALFAGFSLSEFDPSFASRYGPEISFLGLVLGLVGIPLSYLMPRWLAKRSTAVPERTAAPPNKAIQGTRRKRRAPDR